MELVYLWVEDYKNIQKQGFNFSPKFNCHYNGEILTINENIDEEGNKQYIENFFGDNINVTAIVGKNGSGKSSVVKFIRLLLKTFIEKDDKLDINSSCIVFYDYTKNKFLCLDFKLNCIVEKIKNIEIIKDIKEDTSFLSKSIFPILDYSLTYDSSIHRRNLYQPQAIQFFNFPSKETPSIHFLLEDREVLNKIFKNYQSLEKKNQWGIFEDFFQPKFIIFSVRINILERFLSERDTIKFLRMRRNNKVDIKFLELFYNELNNKFKNMQEDRRLSRDEDRLNKYNNLIKLQEDDIIFRELCNINQEPISRENKNNIYNIFKFSISDISEQQINYLFNLTSSEIFQIEIIDINNKKFNELSFGEQQLLKVLNIIYHLASHQNTEKLVIFLDEIDIGFHPEWQKKVLKYILELTKLLPEKKFHLIFSAHSPFIVSDIPKQNIIFLDKDEKGNCKVVNGLKEKKQTFGANIHTLLSDSFFMEDGLMGEFAKGKIDEAIKLLNQDKLDEKELKYCEQIISIIGEPIVKNQLQRMLDSKRLSKIDAISQKIKDMSYELEILKEHQSKIVQDELRDKGKKQYKQRFEDD